MALHVSTTSVQNDFRFFLYVFICFCFNGTVIQIENYVLISDSLFGWGVS